jgi:hypothetical protein
MNEVALVVYDKTAHFKCTHKYALNIPGMSFVLSGMLNLANSPFPPCNTLTHNYLMICLESILYESGHNIG